MNTTWGTCITLTKEYMLIEKDHILMYKWTYSNRKRTYAFNKDTKSLKTPNGLENKHKPNVSTVEK